MFKIDMNNFTEEQQKFIKDIALFNSNTDYVMFCNNENIKEKILPFLLEKRLEDVKVSRGIEEIILVHKDMLKYQYKTYIPNEWDNK